jgi:hypothetical protein
VAEVLPVLYLRGLSTGDFEPVLAAFFGSHAGLSASAISRLTVARQAEHERCRGATLGHSPKASAKRATASTAAARVGAA